MSAVPATTLRSDRESAAMTQALALRGALSHIEKEYGKGAVMRMGQEGAQVRCDAIPTGALSLDLALGIGGVPMIGAKFGAPYSRSSLSVIR